MKRPYQPISNALRKIVNVPALFEVQEPVQACFVTYVVQPVRNISETLDQTQFEACEPHEAELWSVYGQYFHSPEVECVADCLSQHQAERLKDQYIKGLEIFTIHMTDECGNAGTVRLMDDSLKLEELEDHCIQSGINYFDAFEGSPEYFIYKGVHFCKYKDEYHIYFSNDGFFTPDLSLMMQKCIEIDIENF